MKKGYLFGIIISFTMFIILTIIVKKSDLSFEKNIFDLLSIECLRGFMIFISTFGEWFIFVLFVLVCLFIFSKRINIIIVINLLLSFIFNNIFKFIFVRERPIWKTMNLSSYSYPSGHSMVSFAFYGLLIYLIYKKYHGKYKKLIISSLSILIFLIGLSRISLGVHYFTDVIGAHLFAIGYLLLFIDFINRRKYV